MLGGSEGGRVVVRFAEGFLEVFLAESVDDFGSWVYALFEEVLFDFVFRWGLWKAMRGWC